MSTSISSITPLPRITGETVERVFTPGAGGMDNQVSSSSSSSSR